MSNIRERSTIFFYLRVVVGVALFLLLVSIIDFQQMGLILVSAKPQFLALGFLTILVNFLLKTYRWAAILWLQEPNISFGQLIRFNFISMFLANFLPGSMSSDIVRGYQVSKYTSQVGAAISAIVVDRLIGIFSTALVTVIAFIALLQTDLVQIGSLLSYGIFAFLCLSIGAPLVLQSSHLMSGVRRLFRRFISMKLPQNILDIYGDLTFYQHQSELMLKALGIALLNLVIASFEFYTVGIGFASEVSVRYYLIFVPLAIFLSMLPISWGGIGVLEVSMIFFFSKVGMPVELCLSIVMVRRILFLLSTLPGGIFYMIEGFPVRKLSL